MKRLVYMLYYNVSYFSYTRIVDLSCRATTHQHATVPLTNVQVAVRNGLQSAKNQRPRGLRPIVYVGRGRADRR